MPLWAGSGGVRSILTPRQPREAAGTSRQSPRRLTAGSRSPDLSHLHTRALSSRAQLARVSAQLARVVEGSKDFGAAPRIDACTRRSTELESTDEAPHTGSSAVSQSTARGRTARLVRWIALYALNRGVERGMIGSWTPWFQIPGLALAPHS